MRLKFADPASIAARDRARRAAIAEEFLNHKDANVFLGYLESDDFYDFMGEAAGQLRCGGRKAPEGASLTDVTTDTPRTDSLFCGSAFSVEPTCTILPKIPTLKTVAEQSAVEQGISTSGTWKTDANLRPRYSARGRSTAKLRLRTATVCAAHCVHVRLRVSSTLNSRRVRDSADTDAADGRRYGWLLYTGIAEGMRESLSASSFTITRIQGLGTRCN